MTASAAMLPDRCTSSTSTASGLTLTITVTASDDGMLQVDGVPIKNADSGYNQAGGWLGAGEVTTDCRSQIQPGPDRNCCSR